jgi:hypothetical protein
LARTCLGDLIDHGRAVEALAPLVALDELDDATQARDIATRCGRSRLVSAAKNVLQQCVTVYAKHDINVCIPNVSQLSSMEHFVAHIGSLRAVDTGVFEAKNSQLRAMKSNVSTSRSGLATSAAAPVVENTNASDATRSSALEAQILLRAVEMEDRRLRTGAAAPVNTATPARDDQYFTGTFYDDDVFGKRQRTVESRQNGAVSIRACIAVDDLNERLSLLADVCNISRVELGLAQLPVRLRNGDDLQPLQFGELVARHATVLQRYTTARSTEIAARRARARVVSSETTSEATDDVVFARATADLRNARLQLSALPTLEVYRADALFFDASRLKIGSFAIIAHRFVVRALRMATKQHCWNTEAICWHEAVEQKVVLVRLVNVSVVGGVTFAHLERFEKFDLSCSDDELVKNYPARQHSWPFAVQRNADGSSQFVIVPLLAQKSLSAMPNASDVTFDSSFVLCARASARPLLNAAELANFDLVDLIHELLRPFNDFKDCFLSRDHILKCLSV